MKEALRYLQAWGFYNEENSRYITVHLYSERRLKIVLSATLSLYCERRLKIVLTFLF